VIGRVLRRARRYGPIILRGRWNVGVCPICEKKTVFVEEAAWLRDNYRCARCRSIPRWRALVRILSECYPEWRSSTMYEAGPSGAASRKLALECPAYQSSQYLRGVERGAYLEGVRAENLEALTFADCSFDLVVTQDVFEHVFRPDLAFAEIARVLRPGGAHVFTVPYYREKPRTVVRAEAGPDGEARNLLAPKYHKGPVDAGGSLVVSEWGQDLPDFVHRHGGLTTTIHCVRDRREGIDGAFREVFVSRKQS
jgi:Methyltransferase domain